MSASIPVPQSSLSLTSDAQLGKSLPARPHRSFHDPSTRHSPAPPLASQDDLALSNQSVELISRAAKRFVERRNTSGSRNTRFEGWDFSQVINATHQLRSALQRGSARAERPPRDGVSGTYFLRRDESHSDVLGVFKPVDEEALDIELSPPPTPRLGCITHMHSVPFATLAAPSSPPNAFLRCPLARTTSASSDSSVEQRSRGANGFYAGEGAYKEVAAYLLDHDHFAGVPQTALAKCHLPGEEVYSSDSDYSSDYTDSYNGDDDEEHIATKMGAFQVYVPNVGDADDFGPGVFDRDQVHRIAILDIRTLNHDRHGGNILVTESKDPLRKFDLVPIDHGYILPDRIRAVQWPIWMDWPMIRKPLSPEVIRYIELLDPESEARRLDEELDGKLQQGSLETLKVCTKLLQKGVAAGLNLYEIGLLMYTNREDSSCRSDMEKIMSEAEEARNARERDFNSGNGATMAGLLSSSPKDLMHRRHQSMSAINIHESMYRDDYIVRYACRRLDDVISRAVAKKKREAAKGGKLRRARSIPDFGIGFKPLYALMQQNENAGSVPLNTPVSSPMAQTAVDVTKSLEAQLKIKARQKPIQIPINDRSITRIAIPPLHSVEQNINHDISHAAHHRELGSGLPPLFKVPSCHKTSPVAPFDVHLWGSAEP